MDVTYRQLAAADWAAARDARLAALAEAPYAFASTLDRELGFTDEVWRERAGSGRTVGAWHAGVIVGMATGLPEDDQGGWHLVGMWVAPKWRGQEVATKLVAEVCAMARHAGGESITLWVTEVNDRARAFYRKTGFQPTGTRQLVRPDEPDRWEEELAMRFDQASAGARTGSS